MYVIDICNITTNKLLSQFFNYTLYRTSDTECMDVNKYCVSVILCVNIPSNIDLCTIIVWRFTSTVLHARWNST